MATYKYTADDQSLLTPFLYKFFVYPLLKLIPMSVPANIITLLSNSCVIIAFVIAYINYANNTTTAFWLIPVFCFAYLVGDCSDGIQARRTGTGSPLGEYFDHFLDSFVTGFLVGIFLLCFRVINPLLLFLSFQLLYIGQIGTFWERLNLGVMRFFKFSTSEGIIGISIFSSLYAFEFMKKLNAHRIFAENAFLNLSIPEIIIAFGFIVSGITGFITIFQTKKTSLKLILHIIFSFAIGAVLVWKVNSSILLLTFTITFYNVFFIGSILEATNEKGTEKYPDFIIPLSCGLFFIFTKNFVLIQAIQIIYLFFRILFRFGFFLKKYKQYWYWQNPAKIDSGLY